MMVSTTGSPHFIVPWHNLGPHESLYNHLAEQVHLVEGNHEAI